MKMTKMKKLASVLLAVVMAMGLAAPAWASNDKEEGSNQKTEITISPCNNRITGFVNQDGQIIRTLIGNSPMQMQKSEIGTISDLRQLGFSEAFLEDMDRETLHEYAKAKSIVTVTTYYKHNIKDNSLEMISREQGEALAAEINQSNNITEGIHPTSTRPQDYNVLIITASSAYLGDDQNGKRYSFGTSVEWKTDPTFKITDAIGVYATYSTIEAGTGTGTLRAKKRTIVVQER